MYLGWSKLLPSSVEVVAMQPPGRGRRLKEAPFTEMGPLVRSVARAAGSLMDRPYAIFGHSLGALTGFALALELFPPSGLCGTRIRLFRACLSNLFRRAFRLDRAA